MLGSGLRELPLNGELSILAVELQNLHKDPADRFIAATALFFSYILITADARLLEWPQKGFLRHNANL
ncbi:PIN domain-containing protein [Desulfonatronum parangueonense]